MGLPVMVCRDQGNRHWITDGTRSALIFPPERDVDEFDSKRYIFDYSIDRAEELLSVVDPIIRENFPYDEWVHANWLLLTAFQLLSEYPRGSLQVDRMSLEHDSSDSSGQLQIKIQGTEKLFRVRRFRPRRRGRMIIEIYVQPDASVTLTAQQATLGLMTRNTWQPDPREIQGQARQVVDVALEFMWECVEIGQSSAPPARRRIATRGNSRWRVRQPTKRGSKTAEPSRPLLPWRQQVFSCRTVKRGGSVTTPFRGDSTAFSDLRVAWEIDAELHRSVWQVQLRQP